MSENQLGNNSQNNVSVGHANTIKGDFVAGNQYNNYIDIYLLSASREKNDKTADSNSNKQRREPYKFLSYYQTTDEDIFYGREGVSKLLTSKISDSKLVVINGQSGSGKTSLINAGIIPKLVQKDYLTMVFRDYGYPTKIIKNGLASLKNIKNINLDLSNCQSLLDCLQTTRQQIERPLVIFFDQFERFFLNLTLSKQQEFIQEFSECFTTIKPKEINFFIAIRQDFYGNLGEFWDVPEYHTESYHHYLKTLNKKEAIAAITEPIKKIPDKIGYERNFVEETLLPNLVKSSERENQEQINPVHLQIVCNSLFDEAKISNASAIESGDIITIGQELYTDLGEVEGILQGYVTKILEDESKFSFDDREIAKSVLKQMVTSQETRVFRSLEDLNKRTLLFL